MTGTRTLRRDAEVNLTRILVAARDVFAEQGYDASMETIAERAEVGVGTLYRRFPTKADLFDAVVDAAKSVTGPSPRRCWPRWRPQTQCSSSCAAAGRAQRLASHDRRTALALQGDGPRRAGAAARGDAVPQPPAGTVRHDVEVTDSVVVLMSVRAIADVCDTGQANPSARFLELVLDGCARGNPTPAYGKALTVAQFDEILRQR